MLQVGFGVAEPAGFLGESEHRLHHRQGDQLRVGQFRGDADLRPDRCKFRSGLQKIVGADVKCRREGVQISVHLCLQCQVGLATLILDTLPVTAGQTRRPLVGSGAGAVAVPGGRPRSLGARGFPSGCPTSVAVVKSLRFQLPPVEPCMRFSRTRLTDVVHRRHSVSPARPGRAWVRRRFRQGRSARGDSVTGRTPPNVRRRGSVCAVC